ncbi:MAG: thioredoxin [Ruminococcus sp.]|nr:thioredoxin [Ruminococcus sp.]
MPARVGAADFRTEVLEADRAVLVDFYSDSCIPCKRMSPVLSQLEAEFADSIKIVKVNVNFEQELAEEYEVQSAPTLVFFRNGTEVDRIRGAVSKDELAEAINSVNS